MTFQAQDPSLINNIRRKGNSSVHKSEPPRPRDRQSRSNPSRFDESWIAIQGLRFLAGDRETAERFFALSGLDATTLRAAATAPGFAVALIDFLVQDESILLRFCAASGADPAEIASLPDALDPGRTWS
ncbi:MAG TPA: DUF3572 family protein [Lichenihabitans sp.]|nr:DUF3572 family protein [Lichenihabitans sp.]